MRGDALARLVRRLACTLRCLAETIERILVREAPKSLPPVTLSKSRHDQNLFQHNNFRQ